MNKYYVYILKCNDDTYYTGYTTDLERRLIQHNSGTGAKYTSARRPCLLVYFEEYNEKKDAMKREWYIKHKLTRKKKEELIKAKGKVDEK